MGMREKLIELLASKVCDAYSPTCDEWQPHNCGKCYANDCRIADLADHLIANGVTFAEDINVPSKWISVKDRLPEHDGRYLCNVKSFSFKGSFYITMLKYDKGGFIEGRIYTDDVTHWMPLPEPPISE